MSASSGVQSDLIRSSGNPNIHVNPLSRFAVDPDDTVTQTFMSAIDLARSSSRLAGRPAFGLDAEQFRSLLDTYFPGAAGMYLKPELVSALSRSGRGAENDEFDDLVMLLNEHRANSSTVSLWLCYAIPACCMGDDHLWQDMGLPNREALSKLIARWFPELHSRNAQGMRWKKFLYKQLCERDSAFVCRSPSCAVCVDYSKCFGSEEDTAWTPQLGR